MTSFSAFVPSSFAGASLSHRHRHANALRITSHRHSYSQPAIAAPRMSASSDRVLIVNTKGGGHGHIGLHLADTLLQQGHTVHIHQLGDDASCPPVRQYPNLARKHADTFTVAYGAVPDSYAGTYSVIFDNNAKSDADIAPAIAAAKSSSAQLFYVSSAGAYKYDGNVMPHSVDTAAKGATIDVENTIRSAGVSAACFRPIYIIGPHTSKREYVDFFFDRIVRGRPLPVPGTGDELVSISDVRDVAALLAAAVGKELENEIFNSVNTRAITFAGMVQLCAQACGKEADVVYYNPEEMAGKVDGFKVKKAFPFRPRHFFADPAEAQLKLGWSPTVSGDSNGLAQSLKECFNEYVQMGLDKADVDFSLDDKILASV